MDESATDKKRVVDVKKWNVVAMWRWNVDVENCAICKNAISDMCVDCHANAGTADECKIV